VQIGVGGLALISNGERGGSEKFARFPAANSCPFRVIDAQHSSEAQATLRNKALDDADLPAVISGKWILKRPELRALADKLGLSEDVRPSRCFLA